MQVVRGFVAGLNYFGVLSTKCTVRVRKLPCKKMPSTPSVGLQDILQRGGCGSAPSQPFEFGCLIFWQFVNKTSWSLETEFLEGGNFKTRCHDSQQESCEKVKIGALKSLRPMSIGLKNCTVQFFTKTVPTVTVHLFLVV